MRQRGGLLALAALLGAGIGGERGPREILPKSHATNLPTKRKRDNTGLGQAARRSAQIAKGMLVSESTERFARWVERRLAIAVHRLSIRGMVTEAEARAALDPAPRPAHTTRGATYRKQQEAARAARRAPAERKPRAAQLRPVRQPLESDLNGDVRLTRWGKAHRLDTDGSVTLCGLPAVPRTGRRFRVRARDGFCVQCADELERRFYDRIREEQGAA